MSLRQVIKAMLAVRDAWTLAEPNSNIRNRPFRFFRDWLLETYQSADAPGIGVVTDLLRLVMKTNPSNYTAEVIREKLDINSHRRTYRYTYACDGEKANYMVRHFFLSYIDKPSSSNLAAFLCHPWTSGPQERVTNSAGEASRFPTQVMTPFERLLALHLMQRINARLGARPRGQKRASASASASSPRSSSSSNAMENGIPVLFRSLSPRNFHRFCYAVQRVVSCWSMFVKRYGWEDAEDFIKPYVVYNPTTVSISPIETRVEGFPVDADVTAETWPAIGQLTTIQQPAFSAAFNASAVADDMHRKAARAFLDHAFTTVTSMTLYTAAESAAWGAGGTLTARSRTRPASAMRTALPAEVLAYFATLNSTSGVTSSASNSGSRRGRRTTTPHSASTAQPDRAAAEASTAGGAANPQPPPPQQPRPVSRAANARQRAAMMLPPPSEAEIVEAVKSVKDFVLGRYTHAYNCTFDDVIDSYNELANDSRDISNRAQFVLCDPPFNIRRERGRRDAAYDRLSFADMKRVVTRTTDLLRKGGHVIIMCSREQHMVWQRLFECATEEGYEDEGSHSDNSEEDDDIFECIHNMRTTPTTNLYGITQDPLLFVNKPHHFPHGARYSATHKNGVQYAFHAKRNGVPSNVEREMVDWRSHDYVRTTYPATKHIIDNVPRLAPGEQVRVAEDDGDDDDDEIVPVVNGHEQPAQRTRALRAEQKPVPLLQELIARYTKPGDIVVDLFAGTFSTAVAALSLPHHRIFIGTELDKRCYDIAVDAMCRRIAVYLASNPTDISIPRDVRPSLLLLERAHLRSRVRDALWEAPGNLPQYQNLPLSVVAAVATAGNNPSWVLQYAAEPVHRWPIGMQLALHSCDEAMLLVADSSHWGVTVMRSTINNPNAGRGCFAARAFQPHELIGYYYGTLVYHNLHDRTRSPRKEYGHGVMPVTRECALRNAFRVSKARNASGFTAITDLMDGRAAIQIVPPAFCSLRYINDYRYLNGDADRQQFRDGGGRCANITYVPKTVATPKDLETMGVIEVRASRLINPGEELFGDYGTGYIAFETDEFHEGTL